MLVKCYQPRYVPILWQLFNIVYHLQEKSGSTLAKINEMKSFICFCFFVLALGLPVDLQSACLAALHLFTWELAVW